ncbi:MAG: hypothetical protein E7616_07050 [Ruminococcaceae bacterium]|nr:hypothetical protein [Oscillospiraceae bacterium]
MKKKKIIIISIFLTLIMITLFIFLKGAIESYNYDMDPANGVDIMEGMGAAFLIIIGGLVVFYELDLFYTVYYFFVKPKTIVKSILNILSNVSLLLQFGVVYIARALSISEETNLAIALFFIYVVLRFVYLIVSTQDLAQEQYN